MALCRILAQLRDKAGRIAIPGFYDDVAALSTFERKQLARLPFNESAYRKFLGVPQLFGERGFTPVTFDEVWREVGAKWRALDPKRTAMFVQPQYTPTVALT